VQTECNADLSGFARVEGREVVAALQSVHRLIPADVHHFEDRGAMLSGCPRDVDCGPMRAGKTRVLIGFFAIAVAGCVDAVRN
jgi:hypothetical protein